MVVVGAIVVSGAAVAGTVSAIVEEVTLVAGSVGWVLDVSSPHPAAAKIKAKLVMILIPVLVIARPPIDWIRPDTAGALIPR
ncbi:MAG: hypothetical protein MUP76_07585 [Acidimicrobiia bacterium]|nr:hypothetical protein [Acidimicrobiia bacterium]